MARLVRDALIDRGYEVFLDVEDLREGPFNTALFDQIQSCVDQVVILSPGSLDRCRNEGDWLRLEIAHGIKCGANIVPIMTRGFRFPQEPLPPDIAALPNFQGIEPSHSLFSASMDNLARLLRARRRRKHIRQLTTGVVLLLVLLAGAAGALWLKSTPPTPALLPASAPATQPQAQAAPRPNPTWLENQDFVQVSRQLSNDLLIHMASSGRFPRTPQDKPIVFKIARIKNDTAQKVDMLYVADLIAADLNATGKFQALSDSPVAQDLAAARSRSTSMPIPFPDYMLEGTISGLNDTDRSTGAVSVVYAFRMQLASVETGTNVWVKQFEIRKQAAN
jgi:PBP1b-binding outer membrane lipoprotein LpoB